MTDSEAPESHDLITRDEQGQPTTLATLAPGQTAQFLPKSVSELAHVAKFAADVGMFGVTRQGVAFNIMLAGAHLGLTPYASLEGITLINGRPVVSAQVQWTLILSRGGVTDHSIDSTDTYCEITVRSRKWREPKSQRVSIEDVPKKLAEKPTYKDHPSDMLFSFCVRRLRKRYFPEVLVGALDNGEMDSIDAPAATVDANVIDVGRLEEHLPSAAETPPCEKSLPDDAGGYRFCGLPTELIPGKSGGMFTRCTEGHMMPPPQAVRDAIRGHREGTAAIQQEPVPEAGERESAPGELSADIIDAPAADNLDRDFMEAAGIAPTPAMSPAEVDALIQQILAHLTTVRNNPTRKQAALDILRAHGYDNTPLTSWMRAHPEELPNLITAFDLDQPATEGALPL